MTRREQILKLCEKYRWESSNDNFAVLIKSILNENEKLRRALELGINAVALTPEESWSKWVEFVSKARQAVKSSPLDELLEKTK